MTATAPADSQARILVVDDERDNRELLAIVLRWEGFMVLTAESGEEALAIAAQELPDLVLLDIMMPGMTGYQVLAAMKAGTATRHIPVIVVTAMEAANAKERALGAGAADLLAKPVVRGDLLLRVRSVLRKTVADALPRCMDVVGDQTIGFTCDVGRGCVTLSIRPRTRAEEPRAAYRWEATIVCHPSGRSVTGNGDAPYVTFWTAANAYEDAADKASFPRVDWDEVAIALDAAGVRFN